jgi:hypothetical protein
MNIQLLMQMLMGQQGRIPMDEQAPMRMGNGAYQMDQDMLLKGMPDRFAMQPQYRPPQQRLQGLEAYYTNPRNGVMPRRTRLGVEEGFRSDDLQWLLRSLGNY